MASIPQIKYLVQGDADNHLETLVGFQNRVNNEAIKYKAVKIHTYFVNQIDQVDVLHDDAGGGLDIITDLDFEYEGFNAAVLHYFKEVKT